MAAGESGDLFIADNKPRTDDILAYRSGRVRLRTSPERGQAAAAQAQ
jgi:hypothetical protein